MTDLVRTTQGTATIELMPGVATVVNVVANTGFDSSRRVDRQREILADLGEQIDNLKWTFEDLVRSNTTTEDSAQRSLFPSKRKRR